MKLTYKNKVLDVNVNEETAKFLVNELLSAHIRIREILRVERVELFKKLTDARRIESDVLVDLGKNEKKSKKEQEIREEIIKKILEDSGWVLDT